MITTEPTMTNLFLQLGLDASEHGFARRTESHQLAADVLMADAPYWNDAQRQFLAEQLKADAVWAVGVDQLSESLHEDAVQRRTGL